MLAALQLYTGAEVGVGEGREELCAPQHPHGVGREGQAIGAAGLVRVRRRHEGGHAEAAVPQTPLARVHHASPICFFM